VPRTSSIVIASDQNEIVTNNPELVTALDLDQWCERLDSQSKLPIIVRQLILATASVTEICMGAREGVLLRGWDGLVSSTTADDPHVPLGVSGWELGTGRDSRRKAQSDFRNRIDNPEGVDPATTTYVAVTARCWKTKKSWRDARRREGRWADVRAYDAHDLEVWMERAPRAHIRISEMLGREPRDVMTPEAWWENWHTQTYPALPHAFLLAGREEFCAALTVALARPPQQVITVLGPSRTEALAVICASLVSTSGEATDEVGPRALVVSDARAWDRLVDSDHALVLIPTFDEADISAALRRAHRVVVPVADDVPSRGIAVEVPSLNRWKAADALLEESGSLGRDVADRYAGHGRRNLISFRRTIAVMPSVKRPPWSEGPQAGRLAPLVLAGSWSDDAAGDRTVIEALTGRDYADLEGDLAAWSAMEDAPLYRSGQMWRVVSRDDAWNLLFKLITRTHLTRFHDLAAQVLQEPDPALDVEPRRRFMANIIGEPRRYSARLRASLADTAAFLAGYVGEKRLTDRATGTQHASRLVRAVTGNLNADTTGRAWQSLADVFPLLAEASPEAFLGAVEAGLAGDEPPVRSLFMDSETASYPGLSSPHIQLVWALKTLCWSSADMSRAAAALARLADIDPEPRALSGPRPAGSLAEVFCLLAPQTSISSQDRIAVLDQLRHRSPRAAWSLLRGMLPVFPSLIPPEHHPRWRDWPQNPPEETTDLFAATTEVVTRLLDDAGDDPDRWIDLLGHFESLPPSDRDRVLTALEVLCPDSLGDPGRISVWRALVELCGRHRQFLDMGWAMPADVVDRMERGAERFAPTSATDLYADLFDDHPRLPGVAPDDFNGYYEALGISQRDAAHAVLDGGGVRDLLALGATAKQPFAVGWAAAADRGDDLIDEILPLLGTEDSDGWVARGYAGARIETEGLRWLEYQLQRRTSTWTVAQRTGLLLAVQRPSLPFISIVEHIDEQVKTAFWQRMNPMRTERTARQSVARKLVEHGRPWTAISVLVVLLGGNAAPVPPLDVDLVESILFRAGTGPSDDAPHDGLALWGAGRLLDHLEGVGSNLATRARLEFLFAPILHQLRPVRALGEALRTDPAVFAEVVSNVFLADGEPNDQEISPVRQAASVAGITALRSWRTPPGVRPDRSVDGQVLRAWVVEARRLLSECGHTAAGDRSIGRVLADVPSENDGLWPAAPVRDLIEELGSDAVDLGVQYGTIDRRSVASWSLESGGAHHRALAGQLRGWAGRVGDQWRTAALLRKLATHFEDLGRWEDDLSEEYGDRGP
jgi:hypothetical protein